MGCGGPLLLPVTEKVPEPPPASLAREWTWYGDKSYMRKNANRSHFDLRLNGSCQSRFVRRGRTGPASDDSAGKAPAALTLFDESAERLTSTLCRFVKVIKSDRSCCHRKAKDLSLCLRRGWTTFSLLQFIYNLSPRAAHTEIHLLTGPQGGAVTAPLRSCCA